MNDVLLFLSVPVAIFCAVTVVKVFEVLIVDCFHKWGMWQTIDPKNETLYVQQRFCKKCNLRHISQIKKEKNGSAL